MLALMDADYKFICTDVGHYGSNSDSQLFLDCDLHQHLEDGTLVIPPAEPVHGDTTPNRKDVPYFIVVDAAFPLCNCLMMPYSHKESLSVQAPLQLPPLTCIQQDAIAGTWKRHQVDMAAMQQQLPPCEGTHDAWQMRNYMRVFHGERWGGGCSVSELCH